MPSRTDSDPGVLIRPYQSGDEAEVIALWEVCGLARPWNDARKDIGRKLTTQPELFLVALVDDRVVGSAMAGFDGHRGWVNYLAVLPEVRRRGLGRTLMRHVEQALTERGCPKINLQIRADNHGIADFYQALGYQTDPVLSMGKRLIRDD